MFQWLFVVCFRFIAFKSVGGSWIRIHSLPILLLALVQSQGLAAADHSPPKWSGPRHVISDDGYASLDWTMPGGETADFFKITEVFKGQSRIHYVENRSLNARRLAPGDHEFTLQACVKDNSDIPRCGVSSNIMTMKVTNAVSASLVSEETTESTPDASSNMEGGPAELRPGDWYNPAKDGHGWSFFWANRLALTENDPLFGNSYDLVGIWYTFEAKFAQQEPDCPGCPPITGAYRPVVLKLKAVQTAPGIYGGSLYVSQAGGSDIWVGGADVIFGADSSSATVNWSANFKKETLSDSDPLVFLHGSDPTSTNNISHFSGIWERSGNDSYYVVSDISTIAELLFLVFHDSAGDPVWIQALNSGTPVSGSTDFCLAYLTDGYSPQLNKPGGWIKNWHMSGCDSSLPPTSTNRNGKRYFTFLHNQFFWTSFTLPGTDYSTGSVSIGSSSSTLALKKTASFHGVRFDNSSGSSCEIINTNGQCPILLTWYTDGNYPDATVFAHNLTDGMYTKVATSTQPAMVDVEYNIGTEGVYEFELRMGDSLQSTLIVGSTKFTVTKNIVNSPPTLTTPPDQVTAYGIKTSLILNATDPDVDDVLTFNANNLPSGLYINTATGRISGKVIDEPGNYLVTVSVEDNHGNSDSTSFTWTITPPVNRPPTITEPGPQNILQGAQVNLSIAVNDVDNDVLTCSSDGSLLSDLSVQISTDYSSCLVTGLLQESVGEYLSKIIVTDTNGASAHTWISWNVLSAGGNPDVPPSPVQPPGMTANASSSRIGFTAAEFRVDETGNATYIIPILTAPVSGGLQPQISLDYSSSGSNGEVGVGWALGGLSTIRRCPQTIEQDGIDGSSGVNLDQQDRFCLDGQRLMANSSSGAYGANGTRYRTEIDDFTRVTSYGSAGNGPAWFKVERKDGTVTHYGNSPDSRIEGRGGSNPSTVITWAQNRLEDRFGNYMLFSYLESSNGAVSYVLKEINYGANSRAGTKPSARLSFTYRDRSEISDLTYFYLGGTRFEQRKLLKNIRSQGRIHSGSPLEDLRFYDLVYEEDGFGRQILTSLTECRSSGKNTCFQPTRFDWLRSESTIDTTGKALNDLLPKSTLSGLLLADVSGDGRPDLLYTESIRKQYYLKVKTATAGATFATSATRYQLPKKADGLAPQLFAIDINADGFQDVIYNKYLSTSNDYSWVALISTGNGFLSEMELNPAHRYFLNGQSLESRFQIMDFNGDGLSDILHSHTNASGDEWHLSVLLNEYSPNGNVQLSGPINVNLDNSDLFPFSTADGWEMSLRPPFYKWGVTGTGGSDIPDARVFDFNGDGAVDMLLKVWRQYEKCIENCIQQAPVNGGKGSGKGGKTPDPVYRVEFASFWVLMESDGLNAFNRQSIVALGDDCTILEVCGDPAYSGLPNSGNLWPVDINADGLADLAWGDPGHSWYFQLNTGQGFEPPQVIGQISNDVAELARFEDWNGDAYPDLIYPSAKLNANSTWMVYQNHFGRMFAAVDNSNLKTGNVGGDVNVDQVENDGNVFADFDGDGKLDLLQVDFDSSAQVAATRLFKGMNVSGSQAIEPANVISRITNGLGARIEIDYKPLTDTTVYTRMRDSASANWGHGSVVYDLTVPLFVVSQAVKSAPTFSSPSASSQVQYHYVGAKVQAGGRGFLGFAEVIAYDPQLNIRTNTRYRQDFPFIGKPAFTMRAVKASGSKFGRLSNVSSATTPIWSGVSATTRAPTPPGGTLIKYSINEWGKKPTVAGASFPFISDTLVRTYTLAGSFDRKVLTSSSYDSRGNLLNSAKRTYATDSTTAFASHSTSNVYWPADYTNWYLDQLKSSAVTHNRAGTSSITRMSTFEYDSSTGVLEKETMEPANAKLEVVTSYGHDSFGNRTSSSITGRGMGTRTERRIYDSLGRFAIEMKNSLGQVTQRIVSWDAFGNPLVSANIDGVETTGAADLMGRPFISYTETGAWRKTINYTGTGTYCPSGTAFRSIDTGGGMAIQTRCFDTLGRAIRTATRRLDGRYSYTDQYYDKSNRLERVSEPYFSGETRFWNQNSYDELGRVSTVLSAGGDYMTRVYGNQAGNSCTAADARTTLITDGLGHQRIEVKNVLDETIDVYDDNCGLISYEFDAVGNLVRISGADNQAVTMTYDIAGRKTSLDDPDKGYWQYAYNALGEMTRQLDSKSQAIDFNYDSLGRIIHRRELKNVASLTDGNYMTVNRESTTYVTSGNGKGQVKEVIYRSGESGIELHKKIIGYDRYGRVSTSNTTINGDVFAEQTTYDQYSRVFQQFDASGGDRGLRYIYKSGYLSMIREAREGASGKVYQDIRAMDARANVTITHLGNGMDVYASYEPDSGRLLNLSAYTALGAEIQDVDYLFDVLGNLKQRHDRSPGGNRKEIFSYDTLNRLKTVSLSVNDGALTETLSLSYNMAGNIKHKSDIGSYLYNGSQPHAVTSAGGESYGYDTNGNQVTGNGRTISYTVFDKPDRIIKGASKVEFVYGIGNDRYQRDDFEGTTLKKRTLYLGPVEFITEDGSTFFRRSLGGVAIANHYPSTGVDQLSYLLQDHIGSIHTVLDQGGMILATMHFSPFGERLGSNWQTPLTRFLYAPLNDITTRGFTGHEHADEVGVVHMNGRIYDPRLGRFLQADPFVQNPKNSQSLNRYSYALNNPLSYTDPSGYFSLGRFIKKWGRVIVAVAASYITYGAASGWATGWLAGTTLAGSSIATGSIAGAISGFVGGAIISGNLTGAVKGAFSGAILGGVAGSFGNAYSIERIAADSLAGGVSAEIYGQEFKEGALFGALVSSATFITVKLRAYQYQKSSIMPGQIGDGPGFRGIAGKVGGERINEKLWVESGVAEKLANGELTQAQAIKKYENFVKGTKGLSPLGGLQGGENLIFGKSYSSGGMVDYIVEGYAGVHDTFNQSYFYTEAGLNRYIEGFGQKALGHVINTTNVLLASPVVLPSLVPDYMRHFYFQELH